MTKKTNYRSAAMASLHAMMGDLHEARVIDTTTMQDFDTLCLTSEPPVTDVETVPLSPDDQNRLAVALLDPPQPTPALYRAFERCRTLFSNR